MTAANVFSVPRLHVDGPLAAGAPVGLTPGQAHYLGAVMRRAVGDPVRLFNGQDGEFLARVETLKRDRGVLVAERRLRPQAAGADLWLAFAPLKRDATDLLVQKATELGAAVLWPVFTARTIAARVNLGRLRAIGVEAAEQSERLTVPVLEEGRSLDGLLAGWPAGRRLVVAVERAAGARVRPGGGPAGLLVGPEGGFTAGELDQMGRHPLFEAATLGSLVLRAETAAIVGLALLQA